jgi:heptosyltransferase-2
MSGNILICGTNWLGDSIMSMPAVQVLKESSSSSRLTMLVKSKLRPLWDMHSCIDNVIDYESSAGGTLKVVKLLKERKFDRAYIFPNSFRSALIPFLAGIPIRIGFTGHHRKFMLTGARVPAEDAGHLHQAWEYFQIMELDNYKPDLEAANITVPLEATKKAGEMVSGFGKRRIVGMFPGAARGVSKRWPVECFAEVGRKLVGSNNCKVLVFGTDSERDLCQDLVDKIGEESINLAGKTSFQDLAAMLSLCSFVVTNDSGGMHLAAAVGTKVIAIFGITSFEKTGPLGKGHCVIKAEDAESSRAIKPESKEADKALSSISPDRVYKAALELIRKKKPE